jgi:FHA domain-containing protein
MARQKDQNPPSESKPSAREPSGEREPATLERLEQALAEETLTAASLRESLEKLHEKVNQLEENFSKRLGDASSRNHVAAEQLAEQRARLVALGNGREETMRMLNETRAQLARVSAERDELRKRLIRVEGMQTATVTLPDEEEGVEPVMQHVLPSIEDLMKSLHFIHEASAPEDDNGDLHARTVAPDEESQEMISPELVFPEEFEPKDKPTSAGSRGATTRVLVFMDAERSIKYPLYKDVMTIGRSESADIQVKGDFISRVHARLVSTDEGVVIEDVDSKNGIKVNSQLTGRQTLRHGDVLGLGRLRFTFVDTAHDSAE